jgi:hypothetical protein
MRFKISQGTKVSMSFSLPDEDKAMQLTKDALINSGFDVVFTEYSNGATLEWTKPYGPEGLTYWQDKRRVCAPQ